MRLWVAGVGMVLLLLWTHGCRPYPGGWCVVLVFRVDVEEDGDGFEVTCADVPAVRHRIESLWDACTVRGVLAQQAGVADDLLWLQIRARVGAVTVVSDVHPLHWVAFHTVVRPSHPVFDRPNLVFHHAFGALKHEAVQAVQHGRAHTQVKLILSFLDGTKVSLPRHGGHLLRDVVDETRTSGDLSSWVRAHLVGRLDAEDQWHVPIVGVQVGVFGPETPAARRYR
ncbi:hypothetical protein RCH21_003354 [Arthrobacter sp. PL16]|nr:hypothetical protein [Arthrobacter sp. PL16]